jgi:hypothetical protein
VEIARLWGKTAAPIAGTMDWEAAMTVDEEIKNAAARIAQATTARASRIQGELAQIEAKKAAIEAELKAMRSSGERILNFQPQVNGDFQCPTCWVQHENRSVLSLIGGATTPEDLRSPGEIDLLR